MNLKTISALIFMLTLSSATGGRSNSSFTFNQIKEVNKVQNMGSSYNENLISLTPFEAYLKTEIDKKNPKIDVRQYNHKREEDLNPLIKKLHRKLPEYYLLQRSRGPIDENKDGIVEYLSIDYPIDRNDELEEKWLILKEKTKYCVTDLEKALVTHEHLAETIQASQELSTAAHDIEGAILEGKAICEGYALAYKYYMNRLNIPCNVVSGKIINGEPHAWNQVKINGNWYMVDCLRDDTRQPKLTHHENFLVSSNKLSVTHEWNHSDYELCLDMSYDDAFWKNIHYEITAYKGKLYTGGYKLNPSFVSGLFEHDLSVHEKNDIGTLIRNSEDPENAWVDSLDGSKLTSHYLLAILNDELYLTRPKSIIKFDPATKKEITVFELAPNSPEFIWDIKASNGKIYYDANKVAEGIREYKSFVVDGTFTKRSQPLNVSYLEKNIYLGKGEEHLLAHAPTKITFEASDPTILNVRLNYLDEAVSLIGLKEGNTELIIKASGDDRYLETVKKVKINVLKTNVDTYVAGDTCTKNNGVATFKGTYYVSRSGSGSYYPTGQIKINVLNNGIKLLPEDKIFNITNGYIDYDFVVNKDLESYTLRIEYLGDDKFTSNVFTKDYLFKAPHVHVYDKEVADPKYLVSKATCNKGSTYFKSCECGEKGNETFTLNDLLPHKYVKDSCIWSADNLKATIVLKCNNYGCTHKLELEAIVTKNIKVDSTCTKKGVTTYIAKALHEGQTYEFNKDVSDIPLKDHVYQNGACANCGQKDPNFTQEPSKPEIEKPIPPETDVPEDKPVEEPSNDTTIYIVLGSIIGVLSLSLLGFIIFKAVRK